MHMEMGSCAKERLISLPSCMFKTLELVNFVWNYVWRRRTKNIYITLKMGMKFYKYTCSWVWKVRRRFYCVQALWGQNFHPYHFRLFWYEHSNNSLHSFSLQVWGMQDVGKRLFFCSQWNYLQTIFCFLVSSMEIIHWCPISFSLPSLVFLPPCLWPPSPVRFLPVGSGGCVHSPHFPVGSLECWREIKYSRAEEGGHWNDPHLGL